MKIDVGNLAELCMSNSQQLANCFEKKIISPVEFMRFTLERADIVNNDLNAFSKLNYDYALNKAEESERRWLKNEPISPFDGVPVTVKDVVFFNGFDIRFGSQTTSNSLLLDDSPSVSRLRRSGSIIFGITNTPEFGWKAVTDSPKNGVTRNPWDIEKTPGGSSGGAAVAAATGVGAMHLGTDGGGSVRIPASFCGIVGFKPSYGRIPMYPPSPYRSIAHIGPMGRNVGDVASMFNLMSGNSLLDWSQPIRNSKPVKLAKIDFTNKKIGFWNSPLIGDLSLGVSKVVSSALKKFEQMGAIICEIKIPDKDKLLEIFYRHWYLGAAHKVSSIRESDHHLLDRGFLAAAEEGLKYSAVDFITAELERIEFGRKMDKLLCEYDFIISPSVQVEPFELDTNVPNNSKFNSWIEWASFSFPLNLSQQPACSIPCGLSEQGLPVGIQIIGAKDKDSEVLSAAYSYEKFHSRDFLGNGFHVPRYNAENLK